jgi:hypothetical protein
MKAEQVDQALRDKFLTQGARLVFWHDTNGEFSEYIAQGLPSEFAAVTVLDVSQQAPGIPWRLGATKHRSKFKMNVAPTTVPTR